MPISVADTILLSTCVASKKFSISLVSLFSKLTITLFTSLLLSRKFGTYSLGFAYAKFADTP